MFHWINNLRLLSIVAVITIHVSAVYLDSVTTSSLEWSIANLFNSFSRWCVPALITITGVLVLGGDRKISAVDFYKKRAWKILIPFIFWLFFYSFWNLIKGFFGTEHTLEEITDSAFDGSAYYHLWYLYMLIPFYVFAPLIKFILDKMSRVVLLSTFIISLMLSLIMQISSGLFHQYEFWCFWFIAYMPYFLLGRIILDFDINLKSFQFSVVFLTSVFVVFLGYGFFKSSSFLSYSGGAYFYTYMSLGVTVMSAAIIVFFKNADFFNKRDYCTKLSDKTFGIYLVHPILIDVLFFVLKKNELYFSSFLIPVFVFFFVISSASVVFIMRKILFVRAVV